MPEGRVSTDHRAKLRWLCGEGPLRNVGCNYRETAFLTQAIPPSSEHVGPVHLERLGRPHHISPLSLHAISALTSFLSELTGLTAAEVGSLGEKESRGSSALSSLCVLHTSALVASSSVLAAASLPSCSARPLAISRSLC